MIKIRKATLKDAFIIDDMDKFGKQLNRYPGLDRLDPNYKDKHGQRSFTERYILAKTKWILVAEEEDKIMGFIFFKIIDRPKYYKIKRIGYIELLFVKKEHRKKGVSKKLIAEARRILKDKDVHHLKLSVHTKNPAHEVWKKHGFKDYRIDMWRKI